jgi:hypothetical protein
MAGFANFEAINQEYEQGRVTTSAFRKLVSSATATGVWIDLSMTGGGPPPNYYASAPLVWSTLSQSADGGIYHGGAVSPASKRLKSLMIASSVVTTATPSVFLLCDYLGFYPFIDMLGSVELSQSGTGLTRYTDGIGVQAMAVLVAPQVGGAIFNLTYTSPQGSGHTSKNMICNTAIVNGTLVTTNPVQTAGYSSSPFIGLQAGDTGILSIQNVNWVTEDVGLIAIVLVKPIAQIYLENVTASPTIYPPSEKDFAIDAIGTLPEIQDNAYLNFIAHPAGTFATAQIWGMMETIWTA